MNPLIEVAIGSEDWAALEDPQHLAQSVLVAAIAEADTPLAANAEISVLFCNDACMRELNRRWRGIDKPTNVLSFPAAGEPRSMPLLGDIVIAFETAAREAAEAGKPLRDHVAHLLVHGFLHLIDHDHVERGEAEAMEALEGAVLAKLGIADPYRGPLTEEAAFSDE